MADDFKTFFAKLPDPATMGPQDGIGKRIGSRLNITDEEGISDIYREYARTYDAVLAIGSMLTEPRPNPDNLRASSAALDQGVAFWRDAGTEHSAKAAALESVQKLVTAKLKGIYQERATVPSPTLTAAAEPALVGAGAQRS
jgi:hypothetical protein